MGIHAQQSYVNSEDNLKANLASPTFTGTLTAPTVLLTTADTATAATHYMVETGSDGIVRPKTLANARAEIVTTATVNSAAATTVGTITSGTWQGSSIAATYIDAAIARLASPTFTGTPAAPTAAANTNTTQIATTAFVTTADNLKANLTGATFTGVSSGVSPTAAGSNGFRNITMSTSAPTGGADGDVWFVYT